MKVNPEEYGSVLMPTPRTKQTERISARAWQDAVLGGFMKKTADKNMASHRLSKG